ncbi:three-helix bundle dimerization domain-containing protein [Aeromicrobium sp.]
MGTPIRFSEGADVLLREPGSSAFMDVMETLPEQKVVAAVTARVQATLPHVAQVPVEYEGVGPFRQYAGSRVRDYLPILVQRAAVHHLRGGTTKDVAQVRPSMFVVD